MAPAGVGHDVRMLTADRIRRRIARAGLIALAIVALASATLTGCGRGRTGEFHLSGTLRLLNSTNGGFLSLPAGPCAGAGPYIDIADGAVVTISAGADALALGHLTNGTRQSATECTWTIDVPHVPAGKLRYTIAVGTTSERDFSEGDMRAGPAFTIGG